MTTEPSSPASILRECAPDTGLAPVVRPFPREGSLADRLSLGPFLMAPMAGVSDLPFRLLCHEQGAGMTCMEMISAKAIYYRNKATDEMMKMIRPAMIAIKVSSATILTDSPVRVFSLFI